MLTPADIDAKQFTSTRIKGGYVQSEVDDFLDSVAEAYKAVQVELADALNRVGQLERRNRSLAENPTSPMRPVPAVTSESPFGAAEKVLVLAQETADKHVADAQAQADEIVRQASGKGVRAIEEADQAAAQIVADARAEAERIKNDGYADKAARFAAIEAQHQQVQAAYEELKKSGQGIERALRDALSNVEGRI